MTVFDKGGFALDAKQRGYKELSSPKKIRVPSPENQEWRDGFLDGYQAALDRYIPIEKK